MNADRFLEEQDMQSQTPAALAAAIKMAAAAPKAAPAAPRPRARSPYASLRANVSGNAMDPGGPGAPSMGQQQPAIDPMNAPDLPVPPLVARGPAPYPGWASQQYGRESMADQNYEQKVGRSKDLNVYQSPSDYGAHQQEVLDSPIIQGMMGAADRARALTRDFLKYNPNLVDLSPVMGLADYMAKGHGKMLDSYQRPANFDETVAHIQSLLQGERSASSAAAMAALDQTGGLKSGQETAQTGTSAARGQKEGFNMPHPPFLNPFTMATTYGNQYRDNPRVKEINEEVQAANSTQQALQSPNWYTDTALKASIIRGMGVNRVTQNELLTYGQGSPDLWNRAQNAISRMTTGQTLSMSDRHTIEEFNNARLRTALTLRDQLHQDMNTGLGSFLPSGMSDKLNQAGDVPAIKPPADSGSKSDAFASQFMDIMKGLKK